jgi:beta-amylase
MSKRIFSPKFPAIGRRARAFGAPPAPATIDFSANVMAPLHIPLQAGGDLLELQAFESQLTIAEASGIDAVSVDIWWGDVEAEENKYDFSYYDRIFAAIKEHGLKIIVIFSFHQCGGEVGDAYASLLPPWIWGKYQGSTFGAFTVQEHDLEYVSEQGNNTQEIVQLWADDIVLGDYVRFASAFVGRFAQTYANDVSAILVSLGPAGELRYPSYDRQDANSGYPTRGALQCYSRFAVADLQRAILAKYGSLADINKAWGLALTSVSEIQPPSDPDWFFTNGDNKYTQYGRDLIDWYNACLVGHGKKVLLAIAKALDQKFPGAEIGYKVPGVHWTIGHPTYPRAAEVAAGLIQTSVDTASASSGHGYANIVALAKDCSAQAGRRVAISFTCLEMSDDNQPPQYSQAQTLVQWVGAEAGRVGVAIRGENALAADITRDSGWDNIEHTFDNYPYTSLTILRIGDVTQGTGKTRYRQFIRKYRGFPSLYLRGTNNGWGLTQMLRVGTVWSARAVAFGNSPNQGFKFDIYGDWSLNFGGSGLSGSICQNGQNISVASGGSYDITLDEATSVYTASPARGGK